MVKLEAVLFDLDDTLFDRTEAQREAIRLIMKELHNLFAGIDEETIFNAFFEADRITTQDFNAGGSIESSRGERSRLFLRILGLSEGFAEKITEMYVNLYPAVNAPINGAKYVTGHLARRFRLGVISNGSPEIQYQKLEILGIKQLFDCIVISEEVGLRKPDPRIFWRANKLLAKKPGACLHIGDSYNSDVVGAKNAGMQACWFNPQCLKPSQMDIKPDIEIRELNEIIKILGMVHFP